MSGNFKLPDELMGGAVKVIRPTDLRNRVGLYMMEERGIKMGRNVDPGDVQDMIVEFVTQELDKQLLEITTQRNLAREARDNWRKRAEAAEAAPGVAPAQAQPDIEALAGEISNMVVGPLLHAKGTVLTTAFLDEVAIETAAILSRRASYPQKGQGCGQSQRDARLIEGIENMDLVYYGPHECDLCGAKNVIRGSVKDGFGDIRFDWPINEPFIYPNHNWIQHKCKLPAPPSVPAGPQEEKK